MLAARSGNLETVKLLVEAGANVNTAERFRGQTALMLAAVENHARDRSGIGCCRRPGERPHRRVHVPEPYRRRWRHHPRPPAGWPERADPGGAAGVERSCRASHRSGCGSERDRTAVRLHRAADGDLQRPLCASPNRYWRRVPMPTTAHCISSMEMRNLATYSNRPNPPDVSHGVSHMDVARLLLEKGADPNAPYIKTIPPRQAQGNINVACRRHTALSSGSGRSISRPCSSWSIAVRTRHCAIKDGSTPMMAAAGLGAPRGGDEEVTEAGDRNDPIDVMKALIAQGRRRERRQRRRHDTAALRGGARLRSHHRVPGQPGGAVRHRRTSRAGRPRSSRAARRLRS